MAGHDNLKKWNAPMSERTAPPFRADHVGSLLRPKEVLRARSEREAGKITAAQLRAIEDQAIRRVIAMQEEAGLQGITDGEMRRRSWHMDFLYQIGGVARAEDKVTVQFHGVGGDVPFAAEGVELKSKLRLDKTIFAEDFAFLKANTKGTPKLTLPAPSMMHRRGGKVFGGVYTEAEEFFADLAAVYAEEIANLGKLGLTYLQLDDTTFATLCDPDQRAGMSKSGTDGERIHLRYIELFNAALKKKPAGMAVCSHSCRGNFRSSWIASGGYDFLAEAVFNGLNVDGFFLEYDDERSGGFAPLRFVPKGKLVVLGLVTSKRAALESKDELKRRIDQAAKYVPLEQICLSPQCGFSSTVEGNDLTEDEQAKKLRLIVETAREVWG
jgi:5-methyltetrahydropteroyltriglutamate--homocysteine methyltransferase